MAKTLGFLLMANFGLSHKFLATDSRFVHKKSWKGALRMTKNESYSTFLIVFFYNLISWLNFQG